MSTDNASPYWQGTKYLTSATNLKQLPNDIDVEIAFIGRSNAGKSSAINTITGIKGLARTGQTPGRTQMINLFEVTETLRLIDLPGYGYAKVPKVVKERWENTIDNYLQHRQCLRGLVLIMDVRHPLKEIDQQVIAWASGCQLNVHILLTKADKLSKSEQKRTLMHVEDELKQYANQTTVQLFSSLKKTGVDEARALLAQWAQTNEKISS